MIAKQGRKRSGFASPVMDSISLGNDFTFMGCDESGKVDEAIGIISAIVVSQEAEKTGRRLEYYDAVGPRAHDVIAEKGVEISKAIYFSYETFRLEGHFVVIAKALPVSGLKGKIVYESENGKWTGTEDIRQEWLP